jgi:hypothetical protein
MSTNIQPLGLSESRINRWLWWCPFQNRGALYVPPKVRREGFSEMTWDSLSVGADPSECIYANIAIGYRLGVATVRRIYVSIISCLRHVLPACHLIAVCRSLIINLKRFHKAPFTNFTKESPHILYQVTGSLFTLQGTSSCYEIKALGYMSLMTRTVLGTLGGRKNFCACGESCDLH